MIPLRVLLIEDSELDAGLILRQLKQAGYETTSHRVENEPQLVEALKDPWDVIIADYRLPEFNASEALTIVQSTGIDTPFIIVSGAIGEETAVTLMKSGARDYLMKDKLSRLPPVVERELIEAEGRRMQRQAHQALLESERNLKKSQQVAHIGHWVRDLTTGIETWSDEMYRILGVDKETFHGDLVALWFSSVHPDDREYVSQHIDINKPEEQHGELEYRIVRPDGSVRFILGQVGEPQLDASGKLILHTGVVHDITERKLIEIDLLAKMEESQNRSRELEVISRISSRIRTAESQNDLIIIVLQELAKLLEASHAAVAFTNNSKVTIEYVDRQGNLIPVQMTDKINKVLNQLIINRKPEFFTKIPYEFISKLLTPVYQKFPHPASIIAYPIINESQVFGLIYLDFASPTVFHQEQRSLVEAVAEMTGNALNRMATTRELESMVEMRERELESIYKVTSSASATLDIDEALKRALRLTLEAVHTRVGAIFLFNEKSSSIDLIAAQGGEDVSQEIFSTAAVKKQLDRVIDQRKALVIPKLALNMDGGRSKTDPSELSFIGLPMRALDEVLGVLAVVYKSSEQVVLEEMTLLSFIADHLALVVQNARLYHKAERSAILEERSRLSRGLHDSVTQSLYSANLYAAGAKRFFTSSNYSEVDSYLTQIGELTQQALKDMRLLVYELRSPELQRNGLIGALQNRLDAVERRVNIDAEIHADMLDSLPEKVEENLYRIAIEALNNSLKYAQASKVVLNFQTVDNEIIFSIQDNGTGFIIDKGLRSGGLGLITMRERTERIGGSFNIITLPQKGTKIEVKLAREPRDHSNKDM